jgi:outer membrane receptor protein involved in Fe transport
VVIPGAPVRVLWESNWTTPVSHPMKTLPRKGDLFSRVLLVLVLTAVTMRGQTAPAASGGTQDTVKLDPFQVSADSDVGFVAASSLAGGRISTALKDTPVAYSVITKEFLEAFNVKDVAEAAAFTVNSDNRDGDGSQRNFARTGAASITFRGVKLTKPQRNFFPFYYTADSYNLDRVDFARGPNSVLYGAGGAGGTMNSVTKTALPNKVIQELRVQAGSYNRFRVTADVNQPISDRLALRTNVMWDDGDTWKDYEWRRKHGAHLAATFQVTPNFAIRGEVEYGSSKEKTFTLLKDNLSAWDGRTYDFVAPLTGAGAPTNTFLAQAGIERVTSMRWVWHPSWASQSPYNLQRTFRTVGAQTNNTLSLTNYVNGQPLRTPGFGFRNQAMIGIATGVPDTARYQRAIAGSQFNVPAPDDTLLWGGDDLPSYTERSNSQSLFLSYNLRNQLFVEAAGNMNVSDILGTTNVRRGLNEIRLDISRTLPDGSANPMFLRPYGEMMEYRTGGKHEYGNLRVQAAYVKETRFGKFQLGTIAGLTQNKVITRGSLLLLPLTATRPPDARAWIVNTPDQNEMGLYTRFYLDQADRSHNPRSLLRPMTTYNPTNGITENVTPRWIWDAAREDRSSDDYRRFSYLQIAGNADLFKNRLILVVAGRRDQTELWQNRLVHPTNLSSWDGSDYEFRPNAPADYWQLTYIPKNAAGQAIGPEARADVRPRAVVNNVALPLPQYAGDRFRDDTNVLALKNRVDTFTLGGVFNATRWLGVYANVSDTFDLSDPLPLIDGTVGKPTPSRGKDAGVRITLPNGKLALSIGRFDAYQQGTLTTQTYGLPDFYNTIARTPVAGDLSDSGGNIRGLRTYDFGPRSTVTTATEGYEFEMTANFTPAWRLIVNAGYTETEFRDGHKEMKAYMPIAEPIVRQILQDAGVVFGTDNRAVINPALNDPTKINQAKVQTAADAWNNYQDAIIPNILGEKPRPGEGSAPWIGNLASDYRFRSGPLRGLRVGAGLNYRQGQVVGFRGSDTIVNPNNPTLAIDDPSVDETTPVYGDDYYKATASFSYTVTLKRERRLHPKTIQFDLHIDNLLNERDPIASNTGAPTATGATLTVPRNGDFTSPARMTTVGNYSYLTPRNYTLTAKLTF